MSRIRAALRGDLPPKWTQDTSHHHLFVLVGLSLGAGLVVWAAGFFLLRATQASFLSGWNAMWGLGGINFLTSVAVPLPGAATAVLLTLRGHWVASCFAVLGAAVGGTLGAAFLLGMGKVARQRLERRADRSKFSRRLLDFSTRFVKHWTYAGVGLLLIPPFIPRAIVLYAAMLLRLRTVPYLLVVFVGTLVRELIVMLIVNVPIG
jgi:membrane protein YqaA with SNARE-associated domain